MQVKKVTYLGGGGGGGGVGGGGGGGGGGGISLSEHVQFVCRQKKYYFKVYLFLEDLAEKLANRCFCWFPSSILVSIRMGPSMASPFRSL